MIKLTQEPNGLPFGELSTQLVVREINQTSSTDTEIDKVARDGPRQGIVVHVQDSDIGDGYIIERLGDGAIDVVVRDIKDLVKRK